MAKALQEILGGAQQADIEAQTKHQEASQAARQELNELKSAILAGDATTNNPLHDGIIGLYGEYILEDPLIVERYEKVAAHLKQAHLLDPVVVVFQYFDHDNLTGPGSAWQSRFPEQEIAMGLLKGHDILFDDISAKLPTSLHIKQTSSARHKADDKVATGNILIDSSQPSFLRGIHLGWSLDKPLPIPNKEEALFVGLDEQYKELEIIIGREKIATWLADTSVALGGEKIAEFQTIRSLSQKLGINPILPATERQRSSLESS